MGSSTNAMEYEQIVIIIWLEPKNPKNNHTFCL